MDKKRFLVATGDGPGPKSLMMVWAASAKDIRSKAPALQILDPPPDWMTDEQLERVGSVVEFDIDDSVHQKMLRDGPDLTFRRPDVS